MYAAVKLIHIASATVLLGTGIGIAFFMLRAYLSGSREVLQVTAANVVLADGLFTAPAVVVQLATGMWLTRELGIAFDSPWFTLVIGLFFLVGACWLPVVGIQVRIRNLSLRETPEADGSINRLMRWWIGLGIAGFLAVLGILYLMVFKAGAY